MYNFMLYGNPQLLDPGPAYPNQGMFHIIGIREKGPAFLIVDSFLQLNKK